VQPRFLTLADVAEILNVSATQAYALVRRGDIRAIKVGGRGQWRIEADEVERYIQSQYAEVAREIHDNALARGESALED
jgi:excisionase family DNA binding protein